MKSYLGGQEKVTVQAELLRGLGLVDSAEVFRAQVWAAGSLESRGTSGVFLEYLPV